MTARFAVYTANDPDDGAPGFAGFVEGSNWRVSVGWRLLEVEVTTALCAALRRHGCDTATDDDGRTLSTFTTRLETHAS